MFERLASEGILIKRKANEKAQFFGLTRTLEHYAFYTLEQAHFIICKNAEAIFDHTLLVGSFEIEVPTFAYREHSSFIFYKIFLIR